MNRAASDLFQAGREAMERHAWQDAYETLTEADEAGLLTGDGLRMLAEAAWWSGQGEKVLAIGERAYGAYVAEENTDGAAMAAFELAQQHAMRMAQPTATGWFARAEQLIADDQNAPARGYLEWMRGFMAAAMEGDPDAAIAHFDEALEIASRTGDRGLQARSLHDKGRTISMQGHLAEGAALMDEAMVAVVGGEVDPIHTGIIYCSMIGVCSTLCDYRRAAEWTDATMRWCERASISGFPGVCRVHRAEIMRLRGAWPNAEEEARRACEELPKFNFLSGVGHAFYEIAEVRRRMGDFAGAEEAYSSAHEHGRDPQPGLSRLRLAQGKLDVAAAGVRRALADPTLDHLSRPMPLAAQAEIALAGGDLNTAAAAAEELDAIAAEIGTPALEAMAACVRGAVRLAGGDPEGAVPELRRALHGWQGVEAPYEAAEARVLLGSAYRAMDDHEGALLELRAARDTYERLGAAWDAERTAAMLGDSVSTTAAPERVRRAFVFTDIVSSTGLVEAIGDEAWENLLNWHDQTLRSLFASHGGEVANHTGDGFFVAFGDADSALRCAVAIQRALAQHRQQHGFAVQVRIGVHSAEATRRGQDYSGGQVHKAARIAALAEAGEILASEETVAAAEEQFSASESREVALKGIAGPVQVLAVAWR
ncbi:MAG TPA: adenylate/guanylate cyclase domain-containing protein [Egibacteraceae bacterium]|nr:adenylate/guanylate cyclase domain-containing protein [Egibacteraceae bacterium]